MSLLFVTKGNAVIKDTLVVTVGNKAITLLEIVEEIKILLILNNQSFTQENKAQLQSAAMPDDLPSYDHALRKIYISIQRKSMYFVL